VLVVVGTAAVLAGLGYGLIKYQFDALGGIAQRQAAAEAELALMEGALKRADLVESVSKEVSSALAAQEASMASGDLYAWMLGVVRKFQKSYPKVELPQLSPMSTPGPVSLLPAFPYKQATMQISGSAYFHDLGQFLADFENQYPLMRVVNLSLDPHPSPAAGEREKLAFRVELITLVK